MPHAPKINSTSTKIENTILADLQDFLSGCDNILQQQVFSWENLIIPLETLFVQFNKQWFVFQSTHFLANFATSNDFLTVYKKVQTSLIEFYQNSELRLAITKLEHTVLSPLQSATLSHLKKTIETFGGDLTADQKKIFIQLTTQLSELNYKFIKNIQETSKKCRVFITRENSLTGIPTYLSEIAAKNADRENMQGWLFPLNEWSYRRVIELASRRSIRKLFYNTRQTVASNYKEDSIYDNAPLIEDIINTRLHIAKLFGFHNIVQYLCHKHDINYEVVSNFFETFASKAQPFATDLLQKMQQFACKNFEYTSIEPWDSAFCANQYLALHSKQTQQSRPEIFPLMHVWSQLLWLTSSLFNLQFKKIETITWHTDVLCYSVFQNNICLGLIYVDLCERANKRPGTWLNYAHIALDQVGVVLSMNFMPAYESPSLLNYEELFILFREFGKALDVLLTERNSLSLIAMNPIQNRQAQICLENLAQQSEILQLCTIPEPEQPPMDFLNYAPLNLESKAHHLLKKFQDAHFDLHAKMITHKIHCKTLYELLNGITHSDPLEKTRKLNHAIDLLLDDNNSQALEFYYTLWCHITFAKSFSVPTMINLQKFLQKAPEILQTFDPQSHQKDLEEYLAKIGIHCEHRNPILHSYHLRKKQTHLTENTTADKKTPFKLNS